MYHDFEFAPNSPPVPNFVTPRPSYNLQRPSYDLSYDLPPQPSTRSSKSASKRSSTTSLRRSSRSRSGSSRSRSSQGVQGDYPIFENMNIYNSIELPNSIQPTRNPEIQRQEVDNLHHLEESLRDSLLDCNRNPLLCSLISQVENVLPVNMKFCTFDYLIDAKKIGEESLNGFNLILTYSKQFSEGINIETSCILKSTVREDADNLLYEYFVGRYLNKRINKNFPFFVTTHGLYKYKSNDDYRNVKHDINNNINNINIHDLINAIELRQCKVDRPLLTEDQRKAEWIQWLSDSYNQTVLTCILIESVPYANTLNNYLIADNPGRFYKHSLIPVLFQIYGALHKLRDVFTHYDLHTSNVLLTMLPGHYFSYTVQTNQNVYRFDSYFLIKIIDYGRSYCEKSERLIDDLCQTVPQLRDTRLCDPTKDDPANYHGYQYAVSNPRNPVQTITVKNNKSSDLRCLNLILKYHEYRKNLHYTDGLGEYINKIYFESNYGTRERQNTYFRSGNNISTISDAFNMLCDLVERDRTRTTSDPYYDMTNKTARQPIPLNIDLKDINVIGEDYWNLA